MCQNGEVIAGSAEKQKIDSNILKQKSSCINRASSATGSKFYFPLGKSDEPEASLWTPLTVEVMVILKENKKRNSTGEAESLSILIPKRIPFSFPC